MITAVVTTRTVLPVGTAEDGGRTGHGVCLCGVGLDTDTPTVLDAQQMVHHLEPFVPLRKVDGGDVHDALELALRVIPEEGEDRNDARRSGVERELVLEHRELLHEFGQTLDEIRSEMMQLLRRLGVRRERGVG